ncbi:MAG: diguanylate cyclase [Rhodospirillales bacterium]
MSDVTPSQAVHQVPAADRKGESAHERPERQDHEDHSAPDQDDQTKEHKVEDVASILGVPASEVTPQVQQGLSGLMREFDRQRRELDFLRKQVAFLEKRCDAHPFLPLMSRHALERAMTKVLNRADLAHTENSFVCLQVNGLERVRQEQGLSAADSIMMTAADVIKAELRASDVLGSMGGYGLGIIFTVTSFGGAEEKAAALVAAAEETLRAAHPGVRIAYGIHPLRTHEPVTTIFAAADADLRRRAPFGG